MAWKALGSTQAPPQNFVPRRRRANVRRGACVEPRKACQFDFLIFYIRKLFSLALAGNQYCRRPAFYVFSISYYSVKTHRTAFKLVPFNSAQARPFNGAMHALYKPFSHLVESG